MVDEIQRRPRTSAPPEHADPLSDQRAFYVGAALVAGDALQVLKSENLLVWEFMIALYLKQQSGQCNVPP
ncbi:hypothetical protein PSYMO_32322 [Pseudomonas amygdali pv. mori str. 301020]|uniref:Uncharacterized protein n=1 Tax=Pseudomonas amygdali pv. mori str. 301020 TaxID=629261 RepID=A0A656GJD6_PSEA0|nr:hypothetical protein PSYMO_32322 [Pseudomonas amygdali pv. mori str. 301020]